MLHEQLPPDALPLAIIQVNPILLKKTDLFSPCQRERPLSSHSPDALLQNAHRVKINFSRRTHPFFWLVQKGCTDPTRCSVIQLSFLRDLVGENRRDRTKGICEEYKRDVLWVADPLYSVLQRGYDSYNADFRTENKERFFDLHLAVTPSLELSLDIYIEEQDLN